MEIRELSDNGAEQIDGDSMLWHARAIWRSRWFFLAAVLCGAVWGLQSAARQPQRQTVCLFRSVNPVISHLHRVYWDSVARATLAQIKVMAEAEGQSVRISVRAEADPWIQRLEIRHHGPGDGQRLAEKFRSRLNEIAGRQHPDGAEADEGDLLPQRVRLTSTLNSLQQALRRTRQLLHMPATGEEAEQISATQFHTIAPQITEKLPFEYLPDLNRLRRLQQEATAILEQLVSVQMEGPELAASEEIQRLLDQSMAALLEYWARMDLFMLAGHQTRVEMDVVFEAGVEMGSEYLRRCLQRMDRCKL